jgi:anti-sigma factor RsiW
MTDHLHDPLELQDLVDGRLSAADEARLRARLETCSACRAELDELLRGRDLARHHIRPEDVPQELLERVRADMRGDTRGDVGGGTRLASTSESRRRRFTRRELLGYGLGAAAAGLAAALYVRRRYGVPSEVTPQIIPDVFRQYAAYQSGSLPFDVTTSDAPTLERFFNDRLPVRVHVIDLGMMQYRLLGGRVDRVGGHPSALSAYAGAGSRSLVCVMYPGQMAELPPANRQRTDRGITFSIYRQSRTTAVFWAEGEIMCVLVSDLPEEEVIGLAEAKAVKV